MLLPSTVPAIRQMLLDLEVGQCDQLRHNTDHELSIVVERVDNGYRVELTRAALEHEGEPPKVYHRGECTFSSLNETVGALGML